MRRLTFAGLGTVSALVMILAYPTSHNASLGASSSVAATSTATSSSSSSDDESSTDSDDGTSSDDSTTASSSSSSSTGASTGTSSGSKSYAGDTVQTRWGPVQVQITVSNGKITAATALQYPTGNGKDEEINSYALPILNSEVVSAQSANIDSVSGATVTSDGYIQSLQSALDAANL